MANHLVPAAAVAAHQKPAAATEDSPALGTNLKCAACFRGMSPRNGAALSGCSSERIPAGGPRAHREGRCPARTALGAMAGHQPTPEVGSPRRRRWEARCEFLRRLLRAAATVP